MTVFKGLKSVSNTDFAPSVCEKNRYGPRALQTGIGVITQQLISGSQQSIIGNPFDITFDVRTDTPNGKDPDSHSPTLRLYHHRLWNKALPGGKPFNLSSTTPGHYLYHVSELGEFSLSGDGAIPSFATYKKTAQVVSQIPVCEITSFRQLTYTIGGMMIFPANRIEKKNTINGARGMHPKIADRFDLTLECIRRHYSCHESPLSAVLARYRGFFELFRDFDGYIDFFYLRDLVDDTKIRFFLPFDGFDKSPLPVSTEMYRRYMRNAEQFIRNRGERMLAGQSCLVEQY